MSIQPKDIIDALEARDKAKSPAVVINATVDLAELRAAVAIAGDLIENRNTYPALGCFLITAGTDVAVRYHGIDCSFSRHVKGSGFGAVLIPKRALAAFLRGATGEQVTIKKDAEADDVTLADGAGFVLKAVPVVGTTIDSHARKIPVNAPAFALADGVLAHLFALTLPFVSSEETRYYLNGVCFQIEDEGNTLRAVATNGHQMGSRTVGLPSKATKTIPSSIVPVAAVRWLAKHMAALEVRVSVVDTHAMFAAGGMVFVTKLIEGTFPDWRRVVGDHSKAAVVSVDTKEARRFLSAVRTMRPGGGRFGSAALRIFADQDRPMFEARSADYGTMTSPISGTTTPEKPTDFGLNASYLDNMLKVLGAKTANLLVLDAGSPVRIIAHGTELDRFGSDILILMPMRV